MSLPEPGSEREAMERQFEAAVETLGRHNGYMVAVLDNEWSRIARLPDRIAREHRRDLAWAASHLAWAVDPEFPLP